MANTPPSSNKSRFHTLTPTQNIVIGIIGKNSILFNKNHFLTLKLYWSSQGVEHLKFLERLILYYNCIPSLEEVKVLFELPALKELDLRLNPLVNTYPNYRSLLVHAMPNLRKLGRI